MFTTDSRTERFLDLLGVRWEYVDTMTFALLKPQWEAENLGRDQVRIDAAVCSYGKQMDEGSVAPAPILWAWKEAIFDVLDGRQRLLAAELRKPATWSAYVVRTDSEAMITTIRLFANLRLQGGYQVSPEWTLARAVELLVIPGLKSIADAAALGGWTPARVRDMKQVVLTRTAIVACGGPPGVTDAMTRVVAKHADPKHLAQSPKPAGEFVADLVKTRLTADEAEPHVKEFFNIPRKQKKPVFNQMQTKLQHFRTKDGIQQRLADPTRARKQAMTDDGKLLKMLAAARTTAQDIADRRVRVELLQDCNVIVDDIQRAMKKIAANSRKAAPQPAIKKRRRKS